MTTDKQSPVYILGGARTPFAKAGTVLRKISALDLATHSVNGLLARVDLDPQLVEALALGIVVVNPAIPQMGREVALASRLSAATRAYTLTDNCITGATAVAGLCPEISAGRMNLAIASGVESMSNPALSFNPKASRIFLEANFARSPGARLKQFMRLRPGDFLPARPGIKEPSTGLSMGEHVELMVKHWQVPREEQDEIAVRSHQRAHAASEDGRLRAEIVPLEGIESDPLIRANTSAERLAALKPVFDRSDAGTVTAGNASPLTDGAASLLLASEAKAQALSLSPLARVADVEFAAIDPADGLLMAPGLAVPRLLRRHGLQLDDIDLVEVHEAFGGQVACNLRAWAQGWKEPAVGSVDVSKLNRLGSSIACGHPFAATGIRILLTLANEMSRTGARYGLVSICGAGATAAAVLLERP